MPLSRAKARSQHTAKTGHDQFTDTIYGLICATCRNYVLVDNTNCPPTCREHEACRQAYA
jgi:hypothetical protein